MEDSLLALKIFGGITKTQIPLDAPESDARLDELELIFNKEHEEIDKPDYEKEAADLMRRYNMEVNKQKIQELNGKLAELDEDDDEYEQILREILDLQNMAK